MTNRLLSAVLYMLSVGTPLLVPSTASGQLFLPTAVYRSSGQLAWYTAVADMNGDGKPDLLVINYSGMTNGNGSLAVFLGKGDGTFKAVRTYDSGGFYSESVAVGDLNGDGKPDVVVGSSCNSGCGSIRSVVRIMIGIGDGTVRPAGIYTTGGRSYSSGEGSSLPIIIADVNGDGKPDVLVVNQTNKAYGDGKVGVLIGNGDGTFKPVVVYDTGAFGAGSFAVADLNGDGKLDMAVVNCAPKGTTSCPGDGGTVSVRLGKGDGTFRAAHLYSRGGGAFFSGPILVADVNVDGKPDLLVGNYCFTGTNCGSVGVLLGRGDGTFNPPVSYSSGGYDASAIVLADVNGDRKPDLVVANGAVGVLLGNGNGTFQPASTYATGGGAGAVLVSDLNGDGHPDIVATNGTSNSAGVLLGHGDGTFAQAAQFPLGGRDYASPIVTADLNNDGYPDLVSANWCLPSGVCSVGTVGVLLNNSALH